MNPIRRDPYSIQDGAIPFHLNVPLIAQPNPQETGSLFVRGIRRTAVFASSIFNRLREHTYDRFQAYRFSQNIYAWCEEAINLEDRQKREEASLRIETCYRERNFSLNLSGMGLSSLPSAIGSLQGLQHLNLRHNEFIELPQAIRRLKTLTLLDLRENYFCDLENEIEDLLPAPGISLSVIASEELTYCLRNEDGEVDVEEIRSDPEPAILEPRENDVEDVPRIQEHNMLELLRNLQQQLSELGYLPEFSLPAFNPQLRTGLSIYPREIENNPLGVLVRLRNKIAESGTFPRIHYVESEGLDGGGVSRDCITKLFDSLFDKEAPMLPMQLVGSRILPVYDPEFSFFEEETEENLPCNFFYKAIGRIFLYSISKELPVGAHFHPVLFEMFSSLSKNDLEKMDISSMDKEVFKNLLKLVLIAKLDMDEREATAELLASCFMQDDFTETGDIYASREEFLDAFGRPEKVIEAVFQIARGAFIQAQERGGSWEDAPQDPALSIEENRQRNAIALQRAIEGSLSRDELIHALEFEGDFSSPKCQQSIDFLLQWLQEASMEELESFVFALTGAKTLVRGQGLKIRLFSPDNPNLLPVSHTCDYSFDLPNYLSYAIFKEKIAWWLSAKDGFQSQ